MIKVSLPTAPITLSELSTRLETQIEGQAVPFDDETIATMTDLGRVKKIYKLNSGGGGGGKKREINGTSKVEVDEKREMEMLILGAMALRGSNN